MCRFILIPSIPELFMSNDFRSLPGSFVGRMQYAPTLPDEKRRSQNVSAVLFEAQNGVQNAFIVLFEAQNRVKMLLWYFLRLKIDSKCFWGAFWDSKSSQNVFGVLFEAQNRIRMLLRCFLRLKIEWKCFWGSFWGSKWSESVFEVYLLRNIGDKETAGHLLLRRPAVEQTFWVLLGAQNAVGNYLLLIDTSMRLPWESSWLAKSRTDSMVRALTFFS